MTEDRVDSFLDEESNKLADKVDTEDDVDLIAVEVFKNQYIPQRLNEVFIIIFF